MRAAPAIPGLTDALQGLSEAQWQQTLSKLRRIKLLAERPAQASRGAEDELDAHALVREHFGQQLRERLPDAWREANNRLYEHFKRRAKELPDTIEEMSHLYAAVAHGCEADKHCEVWREVYRRRIGRGRNFSTTRLGSFAADLAALSSFFKLPWSQPTDRLSEDDRDIILSLVGVRLWALGYLMEAEEPFKIALAGRIAQRDWANAAQHAGNLSALHRTLGNLFRALDYAEEAVSLANRSHSLYWQMNTRTTLAATLFQKNRLQEAENFFREAEGINPVLSFLNGLSGLQYCDFLLSQGHYQDVLSRVDHMRSRMTSSKPLRDIALEDLLLGQIYLLSYKQDGTDSFAQAVKHLELAVNGLRKAGTQHHLPRGLLARAKLHRLTGGYSRAQSDLTEAQRIAERGAMGLHLADCHLEWARLRLAQGDPTLAREHWAMAKAMIERMGYHRRDAEVAEIEEQLNAG